jgi:hypothetical protein
MFCTISRRHNRVRARTEWPRLIANAKRVRRAHLHSSGRSAESREPRLEPGVNLNDGEPVGRVDRTTPYKGVGETRT